MIWRGFQLQKSCIDIMTETNMDLFEGSVQPTQVYF